MNERRADFELPRAFARAGDQRALAEVIRRHRPEEQPALRALVPLLDEALLSLRERDRTALLLRYHESQSLRDVGAALGVNEDTLRRISTIAVQRFHRINHSLKRSGRFFPAAGRTWRSTKGLNCRRSLRRNN